MPEDKKKEYNKKYYNENRDKILQKKKEYREQNEDKLKEKFKCECGGNYTFNNKAHHLKTKKHQEYLLKGSIPEQNTSEIIA